MRPQHLARLSARVILAPLARTNTHTCTALHPPCAASACVVPRSFHSSPALYALIRSTVLKSKKKEDAVSIALQDIKNKKFTPEKAAAAMQYPDLTPEQAIKIFDLALKHNVVSTQMCEYILDLLKDKKQPEQVAHVWKAVSEKAVPLSVGILEVVYEMFAEAGDIDKMFEIAGKMETLKQATPRFYNPIIELYMHRGQRDNAFKVIETMKERGAKPDSLTYGLILKFLDEKDIDLIIETYKKMRSEGVRPSGVTVFLMIEAYGKAGMYDKAIEMFDIGKGMGLRMTVNPYISAIRYMGKAGQVKRAADTFDLMLTDRQPQGPMSFQTLMEVYATNGHMPEAIATLEKMRKEGYKPTLATFAILLDALLPGSDATTLSTVVELMKACKLRPDDATAQRFAEFEARNGVAPYWTQPSVA